jgi:hypothetical protein
MAEKEDDASGKKQDPRVDQLRPDPSQPPSRGRSLVGFWGDSDRSDFRRLYLTSDLEVYAEFRVEDVLATADIPPERSPFLGEQATRVELRRDAPVDITHSRRVGEGDQFDLDVRFGTDVSRRGFMYASSGRNLCVEVAEGWVVNYSCGWLCETYLPPEGGRCAAPGPGGRASADCGTDTCNTCDTQCQPCDTDYGYTQCGTCYTDAGNTQCGTCYTDVGVTQCGGCRRGRRR